MDVEDRVYRDGVGDGQIAGLWLPPYDVDGEDRVYRDRVGDGQIAGCFGSRRICSRHTCSWRRSGVSGCSVGIRVGLSRLWPEIIFRGDLVSLFIFFRVVYVFYLI